MKLSTARQMIQDESAPGRGKAVQTLRTAKKRERENRKNGRKK